MHRKRSGRFHTELSTVVSYGRGLGWPLSGQRGLNLINLETTATQVDLRNIRPSERG